MNANINIKQFDEADSYKMRELVNRYTSGSVGNFVYNLPQGGHLSGIIRMKSILIFEHN